MNIFKLIVDLDDETGLTFNALVDRPAHNKKLLAFGKDSQPTYMAFDDSKRMITGVAISANQLIYRFDKDLGEYYVYFEPKEIEKMVLKMSRQQLLSSVNLMHDDKKVVDKITFLEGYFIDDKKRPPVENQNVQNGSYVMTYYVEDEALYNEIRGGKYVGYSVEGLFDQVQINIKTNKKQTMKKTLKDLVFGKQTFAEATTVDGVVLSYEGELEVGTAVFVTDTEGNQIAAPEGSHVLEDGRTIIVDADGIVVEVMEAEAVVEEQAEVTESLSRDEVVEALQKMNAKFKALEMKFTKLQESVIPSKQKFERKEGSKSWKELIK